MRARRSTPRFSPLSVSAAAAPRPGPAAPAAAAVAAGGDASGLAQLDRFAVVATTGGYQGTGDFMTFIRNAEAGVAERGLFEGRGPLAILLLVLLGGLALNLTPCVLPMIPINLAIIGAGAPGRLAQARLPARPDLRRGDGVRLRRPRPGRRPHRQHLRHHQRLAVVQPRHRAVVRGAGAGDVRRLRDRLLALCRHRRRRRQPRLVHAGLHDGRRGGAAGRRLRRAGGDPGGALRQQPLRDRDRRGAGAAVLPRHRHGDPVADCRRRAVVAAQARPVDGPGEAGLRRRDPRRPRDITATWPTACSPIAGSTPPRCRRASRPS